MIVLDTNVVSEPLRKKPDANVVAWLDAQVAETLHLSTVTVAELRFGVARLPKGKRRDRLHDDLENRILPAFAGRVLPFDLAASATYAKLRAEGEVRGEQIAFADSYIAAIAIAHRFAIATRDTRPFETAGLRVINPWQAESNSP